MLVALQINRALFRVNDQASSLPHSFLLTIQRTLVTMSSLVALGTLHVLFHISGTRYYPKRQVRVCDALITTQISPGSPRSAPLAFRLAQPCRWFATRANTFCELAERHRESQARVVVQLPIFPGLNCVSLALLGQQDGNDSRCQIGAEATRSRHLLGFSSVKHPVFSSRNRIQ